MQVRLSQSVHTEKNVSASRHAAFSAAHHTCQKAEPFGGIVRKYTPNDDDGEQLPSEETLVKASVSAILQEFRAYTSEALNAVATRDWGNCISKADVVVDDVVIIKDAPTSFLIWLEKDLEGVKTFFAKLPTLSMDKRWAKNEQTNLYESEPVETVRTKKVPKNHVKAEATDKHPAQVELFYEDVPMGRWRTVALSGAIPLAERDKLVKRVEKLIIAVKHAREEANAMKVDSQDIAEKVMEYLLG